MPSGISSGRSNKARGAQRASMRQAIRLHAGQNQTTAAAVMAERVVEGRQAAKAKRQHFNSQPHPVKT